MCGIWCCIVLASSKGHSDSPEDTYCTVCNTILKFQLCSDNCKKCFYKNLRRKRRNSEINDGHPVLDILEGVEGADDSSNEDKNIVRMMSFHHRRGPDVCSETSDHLRDSCIPLKPPCINNSEKNEEAVSEEDIPFDLKSHPITVHLSGHVLWTQGPHLVPQPYTNSEQSQYFLFNGDIYSFSGAKDYKEDKFHPTEHHDGLLLFNKLQNALKYSETVDELISVVGHLRGPFAFVYFDKNKKKIWFGRDFFGRESLLFSSYKDLNGFPSWNISSVSVFENAFEIPTAGIYELDLRLQTVTLVPYACHDRVDVLGNLTKFAQFLKGIGLSSNFDREDVGPEPCKAISLNFNTLLNVCDKEGCDILNKLTELGKLTSIPPEEVLIRATEILDPYVTKFLCHLRRSVRLRLKAIAPICRNCSYDPDQINCCHSLVGVLFSGGLDSTVLAYLAAEVSESCGNGNTLELLSVAFSKDGNYDICPDRQTALESYRILQSIFEPLGKPIKLVLVNETKENVVEMRGERIKGLISPLKSVIDDSVGCCLWFAARGRYYSKASEGFEDSPVRTVLMGSGADELLGGYSRHRSAYERSGWEGLASEMQLDLDRISIRNMGRDNRVVSDHGLCPRMPFLDEGVVNFLAQECPLWVKCCPTLGSRGVGEKLLLRAVAVKLFGKDNVHLALFPKRAMQFGSRIAKLENSKEKGGDSCDRLL